MQYQKFALHLADGRGSDGIQVVLRKMNLAPEWIIQACIRDLN